MLTTIILFVLCPVALPFILIANYYYIKRLELYTPRLQTLITCCPTPYYTYPYAYGIDFDFR